MLGTFDGYRVEREGRCVTLVLDGTGANALGAARYEGITRVAGATEPDEVLLIRAEGTSFSAGQDLREYAAAQDTGSVAPLLRQGTGAVLALLECPATVVAAVQGPAVGGGALLAAAADVVLFTPAARLRLPELELGMPLGAAVLERLVGAPAARRLALTGAWAEAAEVAAWGGATVVGEGELSARTAETVARILTADHVARSVARHAFGDGERARTAERYRTEVADTIRLLG